MNSHEIAQIIKALADKNSNLAAKIGGQNYSRRDLIRGLKNKNPKIIKLVEDFKRQMDEEFMTQM